MHIHFMSIRQIVLDISLSNSYNTLVLQRFFLPQFEPIQTKSFNYEYSYCKQSGATRRPVWNGAVQRARLTICHGVLQLKPVSRILARSWYNLSACFQMRPPCKVYGNIVYRTCVPVLLDSNRATCPKLDTAGNYGIHMSKWIEIFIKGRTVWSKNPQSDNSYAKTYYGITRFQCANLYAVCVRNGDSEYLIIIMYRAGISRATGRATYSEMWQ